MEEQLHAENHEDNTTRNEAVDAQTTAERREARRRKILANAKNRLDRLNGCVRNTPSVGNEIGDTVTITKLPPPAVTTPIKLTEEYSDPEVEPDIIFNERMPSAAAPPNFQAELEQLFSTIGGRSTTTTQRKQHFLLASRAHVLLAALISYITTIALWYTSDNTPPGLGEAEDTLASTSDAIGFSIFVPAGIVIATELIFFKTPAEMSKLVNLVLALCGLRIPMASWYFTILSSFQTLVADMGIFMFTFCSLTYLSSALNERFVNLVVVQ